ncbi:MAG: helix-turn-helix domain-containing protein [Spirochaetaceae bacterium]|jgi:putative transcriptional regulator|nr:helix-turn-helix domain-containing protein [Spirochaetaceae bacterium]
MSEDTEVFDSIMTGLNQALAHTQGKLPNVRRRKVSISPLPKYEPTDIKKIREEQNLSQLIFAEALGVSIKTIEAWEAGRNKPQGPALRMLQLLQKDTHFLEEHQIVCI